MPQIIPTCSLRWINILYDYWMCRDDPQFVLEHLPAALSTLGWFEQKAQRRIEGTILLPRDLQGELAYRPVREPLKPSAM